MKFAVISHTNQAALVSRLQENGHVVILTTGDFEVAVPAILRSRPHALLVCGYADEPFVMQASQFGSGLPNQHVVLHQPSDSFEILDQQIDAIRSKVNAQQQRATANERILFFDSTFAHLFDQDRSEPTKPEHVQLLNEQDKFLTLLTQGEEQHANACRYLNALTAWSQEETREIAYRMTSDGRIAASFAREQAGRWLSVLAHYIPEVDPSYFPCPGDAIHGSDWVFDQSSPETAYAFQCVEKLNFSRGIREPLKALLTQSLASIGESLAGEIALTLTGAATQLQVLAEAHVAMMSRLLKCDCEVPAPNSTKRNHRQDHQMVCELWEFPLLRDYPALLAKTVADFSRGRRSATEVRAPKFLDIFTQTQRGPS